MQSIYNRNSGNERPATPHSALRLRRDPSTPVGVYTVKAPDERKWALEPVPEKVQFVTFLIQVEEVEQAETFYIVKVRGSHMSAYEAV